MSCEGDWTVWWCPHARHISLSITTHVHVQGAEKSIISKMLVEHSNRRTFPVDRHAGVAVAGVVADGRAVVGRAQAEAQQYKQFYGHPVPGHVLADRLASYVHIFNLYWYVRPMGVTSLLAVYDEQEGPGLYAVDPAGNVHVSIQGGCVWHCIKGLSIVGGHQASLGRAPTVLSTCSYFDDSQRYFGAAVGKGRQIARNEIEKLKLEEMTAKEAVRAVATMYGWMRKRGLRRRARAR